jgi:hypothetical protein
MAEPGLAGRVLVVVMALFWAISVSRRLGFGAPIVLFEKPKPGLTTPPPSGFLGDLGLLGSF